MTGQLHLIVGGEELLVQRAVARIVAGALAADPDAEVTTVAVAELLPSDLDQLLSPSLFAARRVIVVTGAQDAAKPLVQALLTHVTALDDDMLLVLTHAGGAKGKGLADDLKKAGAQVQRCPTVATSRERASFVREEISALGGRLAGGAGDLIVETVGSDLRELATVCAQLVADTGGEVTTEAVGRYHRGRPEASSFAVADAILAGDTAGALTALRWALDAGVDPILVADALAGGVRTVVQVAGGDTAGLPPWKIERSRRAARGWPTDGLRAAIGIAAQLNADVKGGAPDRAYSLERALLAIVAARQGSTGLLRIGGRRA